MSRKKSLNFAAGRLGSAAEQDSPPGQGAVSRGSHYNTGRLGIVSDMEEQVTTDEPQAGPPASDEPHVGAAPAPGRSDEQEHISSNAADSGEQATDAHEETPNESPVAPEALRGSAKGAFLRLGSSARSAAGRTGPGKSSQFNVEVYASSKRRSWVPAAAAIAATVCAVGWFVWQRTESRLHTPQAAAAAAAPLLPESTGDQSPEAAVRPANPQAETARSGTPAATSSSTSKNVRGGWMGKLSRSFVAWAQTQASRPAGRGGGVAAAADSTRPSADNAGQTATKAVRKQNPIRYRDCPPGITLSSVVLMSRRPMACINGNFVTIGSVIRGARVLNIYSDSVEMEIDGERFEVVLGASSSGGSSR